MMPKELQPGVLYVSEEFETAAHLCPCGCGSKVRTPLGPTAWSFIETPRGPSLNPSIGNWQRSCQSHYWIREGEIVWARQWSAKEILAGRAYEEEKRRLHFEELAPRRNGVFRTLLRRIAKSLRGTRTSDDN